MRGNSRAYGPLGGTSSTLSWPGSSSSLRLTAGVDKNTNCDNIRAVVLRLQGGSCNGDTSRPGDWLAYWVATF